MLQLYSPRIGIYSDLSRLRVIVQHSHTYANVFRCRSLPSVRFLGKSHAGPLGVQMKLGCPKYFLGRSYLNQNNMFILFLALNVVYAFYILTANMLNAVVYCLIPAAWQHYPIVVYQDEI